MPGIFGTDIEARTPSSSEETTEVQQPIEANEAKPWKREKPDFDALAEKRTASLFANIQRGIKFIGTLDARFMYRAGQVKDVGVEGAKFVGNTAVKGVETIGGATERGVKALDREIGKGVEMAKTGAKSLGSKVVETGQDLAEVGKYAYEEGRDTVKSIWMNIQTGAEAARTKYHETKASAGEKYRTAKEAMLNRVDMIQLRQEQARFDAFKAQEAIFASEAGFSQEKMAAIRDRSRQRLEAKGISSAESESRLAA